jgi:signal transduction histidine kinase
MKFDSSIHVPLSRWPETSNDETVMDTVQLTNFYRSVSEWPKTPMEMNQVVKDICHLLPASFVALYLNDPQRGWELSFKFADPSLKFGKSIQSPLISEIPALNMVVEDFIKKPIFQSEPLKSIQTNGQQFRQLQISGEILDGHYLGLIPIAGRVGTTIKNFGWLLAALPRAFSQDESFLLTVIDQRLVQLAEVEHLESEIGLRGRFLSIASHELKTPLTSIYGMLQLQERTLRLKKNDMTFRDPEKQVVYLRRLLRQVERLNELIDGLLDISRIQNGRFMVEPSENDVALILREAVSIRLEMVAREAGVTLHVDAPEHLLSWIDPVRFEELVTNLVMNAIRFSPEGGVVWVRLAEDTESFRLTVRDQGPSVSMEDRERIFKPFERAQRTARLGGMGLGLFISRQIAQLHAGNVALVESVPGKGNVFEAHFPLRNTAQATA